MPICEDYSGVKSDIRLVVYNSKLIKKAKEDNKLLVEKILEFAKSNFGNKDQAKFLVENEILVTITELMSQKPRFQFTVIDDVVNL